MKSAEASAANRQGRPRRADEYFLPSSHAPRARKGAQLYTPWHVIHVLVGWLPTRARCRGSGGMFEQSEKFMESLAGKLDDISIYNKRSTTPSGTEWHLGSMLQKLGRSPTRI